jgi:hypothetical protein
LELVSQPGGHSEGDSPGPPSTAALVSLCIQTGVDFVTIPRTALPQFSFHDVRAVGGRAYRPLEPIPPGHPETTLDLYVD